MGYQIAAVSLADDRHELGGINRPSDTPRGRLERPRTDEKPTNKEIEQRLLSLDESFADRLSAFLAGVEYVQAGEYLLALEILCDNLHEYNVPLSAAEFGKIARLARVCQMKQGRVDMLRSQVTR
jgi:hypothetical protein